MAISETQRNGLLLGGLGTMLLGLVLKAATKEVNWKALGVIEAVGVTMAIGGCCGRGGSEYGLHLITAEELGEKVELYGWAAQEQGRSIVPLCNEAKLFLRLEVSGKRIRAVRTVRGDDLVPLFTAALRDVREQVEAVLDPEGGFLPDDVQMPVKLDWVVFLQRKEGERQSGTFADWQPHATWDVGRTSSGGGPSSAYSSRVFKMRLKQYERDGLIEAVDQFTGRAEGCLFRDDNDFRIEDIAP